MKVSIIVWFLFTWFTDESVGLNFGILIVWMAISCGTLTLIQYFVRRRDIRAIQGPVVEVQQNDLEKIEHVVSFSEMQAAARVL